MTQTKDQQAQEYAEKKMENVYSQEWDSEYVEGLIECAFEDGYTACEQSMWRSVNDELPEDGKIVLALDNDWGYVLAVRHAGKWKDINKINLEYKEYRWEQLLDDVSFPIVAWMPIPSLPETNTEKI